MPFLSHQCAGAVCTTHFWEESVSCQSRKWLGLGFCEKLGMGSAVMAKCTSLSHFSVTSSSAWGPTKWRAPSVSVLEGEGQNAIVSKGGVLPDALG